MHRNAAILLRSVTYILYTCFSAFHGKGRVKTNWAGREFEGNIQPNICSVTLVLQSANNIEV